MDLNFKIESFILHLFSNDVCETLEFPGSIFLEILIFHEYYLTAQIYWLKYACIHTRRSTEEMAYNDAEQNILNIYIITDFLVTLIALLIELCKVGQKKEYSIYFNLQICTKN